MDVATIFDSNSDSLPAMVQHSTRPFQQSVDIAPSSVHVEQTQYNPSRPSFMNNNPFLVRETSAPPLGQYHAADVYSNGYAGRVPAELDFHNVNYNDRQLNLITQRMNNMNFEQYLQATENGPAAVDSSDKRIHLRYDGKLI